MNSAAGSMHAFQSITTTFFLNPLFTVVHTQKGNDLIPALMKICQEVTIPVMVQ